MVSARVLPVPRYRVPAETAGRFSSWMPLRAEPVAAHRTEIGAYASKVPPVPLGMAGSNPETSRLLDALEKKYREDHRQMAKVLSFEEYGKEGHADV